MATDTDNQTSNGLADRQASEAQFHDKKYAAGDELYPAHYKVNPTWYVFERMIQELGDLRDKRVAEYGCGEGFVTVELAQAGARVSAFDISKQAVEATNLNLATAGLLDSCDTAVMPGEALEYPDGEFDICMGFAILHHLELERSISEMYRVLKEGGCAVFAEPLEGNPIIDLYRKMTPQFRTPDEQPLRKPEVDAIARKAGFSAVSYSHYYLLALGALVFVYIPGLSKLFSPVSRQLHKADRWLFGRAPRTGNWAWYTVLTMEK